LPFSGDSAAAGGKTRRRQTRMPVQVASETNSSHIAMLCTKKVTQQAPFSFHCTMTSCRQASCHHFIMFFLHPVQGAYGILHRYYCQYNLGPCLRNVIAKQLDSIII